MKLAIKLQNIDAVNVLCDHDADIKHKSFEGDITPLEYAVMTKNRKILKILVNSLKKQKINYWELQKKDVIRMIKNIPDFSINLKLNFDSSIFSLFSSLTPCDSYRVARACLHRFPKVAPVLELI